MAFNIGQKKSFIFSRKLDLLSWHIQDPQQESWVSASFWIGTPASPGTLVLALYFSYAKLRPSYFQPCPEHHLQVISLHSLQQLPPVSFPCSPVDVTLSPSWTWQTSWSLETSSQLVIGVSCGGKRKCWRWWLQWAWEKEQEGVYESQKAKEMKLANFPVVCSRVAKEGHSKEWVMGNTRSAKWVQVKHSFV